MEILSTIWEAKIQILPIILSMAIFELIGFIRRLKKIYYVPIYFSLFPFREINEDLSAYLLEDDYGMGEDLEAKEAETLRKKIIFIGIISMVIASIVTPLITGFVSALYMNKETFIQFLIILITIKLFQLIKSIIHFHFEQRVNKPKYKYFLGILYFFHLGIVFEMLRMSFAWTYPFRAAGDWSGMLSNLSSLIFGKVAVGIILVSLLSAVFVSMITDRKLREERLEEIE